jgi:hypothetical protein
MRTLMVGCFLQMEVEYQLLMPFTGQQPDLISLMGVVPAAIQSNIMIYAMILIMVGLMPFLITTSPLMRIDIHLDCDIHLDWLVFTPHEYPCLIVSDSLSKIFTLPFLRPMSFSALRL